MPFTLVSLADRRTARHRKALQDRAVWTAGDRFVIIIANRPTHESEQIDEAPPVSGQERLMAQWPDLPGAERDSTTRDLS